MSTQTVSADLSKGDGFTLFRFADAPNLDDTGATHAEMSPEVAAQVASFIKARGEEGGETRFLFGNTKFSLVYAYFKSGYPVILHSHDANCLYYILAGTVRIGTNSLGRGDGFFVPTDVPYTYVAGPEGVELLEFRDASSFNTKVTTTNPTYWDRVGNVAAGRLATWRDEVKPSDLPTP